MLENPLHELPLLRYSVELSGETVTVSFYDENNKRITSRRFPVIFKEDVYENIREGKDVNLAGAYLRDFSLAEFRTLNKLYDHEYVKLVNFSARGTFFDCDVGNDFSYAQFEGADTVFESSVFGNGFTNFFNANFGHGDVNFKRARFGSGITSFRSVKFGDGDISFSNTNFGTGDLSFVASDFSNGNVDYRNSIFGNGNVDFKFARFASGDISFERATFGKGKKDFKNVEFGGGRIDFRRIEFNDGDVSFEGVEFGDGKVSFRGARFGRGNISFEAADFHEGEAHFDLVDFGTGTISFNGATVMDISFKGCHIDCFMDLRFGVCRRADLRNTIVRDILDVIPETEKVVISELNLAGMRILGRLFINWHDNDVYKLVYNQTNTSYFQKAEQFRVLKENFRNNGQYGDEDAAYVEFRRCEAKARLIEARELKKNQVWESLRYLFHRYMFDFIGRYATAPIRVLANAVLAVFVFAVIYYFIGKFFPSFGHIGTALPPNLAEAHDFWNAAYYSAITFCTVGYGDYFAVGALKFFAALEGFSGIFLMSYFTVAFVRKILR
jgi:hypothetical protein